ncbi:MAG: hypothetical protein DRN28_03750 [Thermoplasmata archaeon]|nr:MAG: hypothetical protein DRN28_03750 [Thermoplasmata archaeon]
MLSLTKKQILIIVVVSLIPLLLTALVISLSMRNMEEDFSRLKKDYSEEINEERREEVRLNYLSEKGWQLKSAQDTMLERTCGLPENYTLILTGSATREAPPNPMSGNYLYRLENLSASFNTSELYLNGEGAGTFLGTFEIRGVFSFSGNISARVEGVGYLLSEGSPLAGELLQNVSGYVEGQLGTHLWSLYSPIPDAFIMGGGELNIEGSVYGHVSGDVDLEGFTGYILSTNPLSLPEAVDLSPRLQSVCKTAQELAASNVLPTGEAELLFPSQGGLLPLNLTRPYFVTLLTGLDEWNSQPHGGFILPPSYLYPTSTWYILANITSSEGLPPIAFKLSCENLCRYMERNLPPRYRALPEEPLDYYSDRGYTLKRTVELSANISCSLMESGNDSIWIVHTNTSIRGSHLVTEISEEELEGVLPPPGTRFTWRLEEVFESEWDTMKRVRLYIIVGIILSAALLMVFSFFAGRRLTQPLTHLIEGTRGVEKKLKELKEEDVVRKGVRIEPLQKNETLSTGDELEELVDGINSVIEALNSAFSSLSKATADREKALRSLRKSYRALLETARGLEKNEEEMNRFLANISHELRTPLHIMIGRLELLKKKGPEELDRFVEVFSRNLKRLQLLLEDLMAVSMIETGRIALQRREVDLVEITREVVEVMREDAGRKRMAILESYEGEVWCSVDPGRIQAAIRNVLDNAIKFSPEGSKVRVEVRGGERWAVVVVEDSGPGIPRRELKRVFRRFYQVDSSSRRREGGMGMGLYLVKNIIEMHRGRVTIESREGKGTRVEIFLPRGEHEKYTYR